MTPKEKAESLLNKFIVEGCLFANAKKCALITVEEILKESDYDLFWEQVKIEINKL